MVEEIQGNDKKKMVLHCVYLIGYILKSSNYLLTDTYDKLSPLKSENEFMQPNNVMKPRAKTPEHAGKEMEKNAISRPFLAMCKGLY